jgi:hypothetical protein
VRWRTKFRCEYQTHFSLAGAASCCIDFLVLSNIWPLVCWISNQMTLQFEVGKKGHIDMW